jgi:hypothetical protein
MTGQKAHLSVDAGHPAVRIEVLDSVCRVAAKGYGRIDETLPTGLYTVRYRAGDVMEDRDVILRPGTPVELRQTPDLRYASAAPLDLTWTSREYHQEAARRLSREPPYECGQGAQVLVFLRDLLPGGPGRLTDGLSLHRPGGELLLKFDDVAEVGTEPTQAAWAGRNVAVNPGGYRLRLVRADGEPVEMSVVACPGWQTQVFLLRQNEVDESTDRPAVDLSQACILMAHAGQGFEPQHGMRSTAAAPGTAEDLRLMDLACQAIAYGRRGISRRDLDAMLTGKWDDPLLGIFGVHLLLLKPEPDLDLADLVVGRLRGILGDFRHPDVDALALSVGRRRGTVPEIAPLATPPMLRRSWHMLVQATADQPHLISPGSLPDQIADRLWGAGAWLLWATPSESAREPPVAAEDWLSRAVLSTRSSSSAVPGGIEDLPDRVIIGGVTLFKRGFAPPVVEDEDGSAEQTQAEPESAAPLEDTVGPVAQPAPPPVRIESMSLEETRAAVQGLLSSRQNGGRLRLDELAAEASLDQAEFALLVQFETALRRCPAEKAVTRDRLGLQALVERLGLPSSHVHSAMRNLFAKLVNLGMTSDRLLERPSDESR